ncbi:MAG: hypothetical protein ACOC82_02480 [Candidatus Bipolaricaulota bacterium]
MVPISLSSLSIRRSFKAKTEKRKTLSNTPAAAPDPVTIGVTGVAIEEATENFFSKGENTPGALRYLELKETPHTAPRVLLFGLDFPNETAILAGFDYL